MHIEWLGAMLLSEARSKGYIGNPKYTVTPLPDKEVHGKFYQMVEVSREVDDFTVQIDSPEKAKAWNGFFKRGGWKKLLGDL